MKVAIITSGLLPIPATKGGAIETLLDTFLLENEKRKSINATIYSINDRKAKKVVKKNNHKNTRYVFISGISNFILRVINKVFKMSIPINKYYQKKAIKMVNKREYDYVVVENYPELTLQLKKSKVIPYIHSDVFNLNTLNCKDILKSCYKVITVSDYIKSRVTEIDNEFENKVTTIYNSIDFSQINEKEYLEYRNSYREKYGIKKDDFVFAYSGRISQEKGVYELIKAFNKVDIPNKKLVIIGGIWYNSKKKNSYLESLEKISKDDVIYTGYIEHKNIQKILCSVDVGVVPSICNEAAGLSVVEFMNTENVVVASNMGGISEYLNKEGNYLVEYTDNNDEFVNNLALAMENSYRDRENMTEMKKNNYEFSKKFTPEENYRKIIECLESSDEKI